MNLTEQLRSNGNLLVRPPKAKKPRKRLSPVSKKRREALKEYYGVRREFLEAHPFCQAGPRLKRHFQGCTKQATEIHHKLRRGPHLCDVKTFIAVCPSCHRYIETHANLARALHLLQ